MKIRLNTSGGVRGAWLTVGRSAAGAFLVAVAVSACTTSGSNPSTFTRTPQTGVSTPGTHTSSGTSSTAAATGRAGASASASAHTSISARATSSTHATSSAQASSSPKATPGVTTELPSTPPATRTPASTSTAYPTAAPQTGGGGTAGLQDGLLFGIGGAAVLAGLGSLAYRRRLARKLAANRSAPRDQDRRDPANR